MKRRHIYMIFYEMLAKLYIQIDRQIDNTGIRTNYEDVFLFRM
jgi:hypothetical protein